MINKKTEKGAAMTFKSLQRNTLIFVLWTFVYFYCLNWFLRTNWGFDMFYGWHWRYIFQQWWYDGWIIQGTYYWTFVVTLFLAIPIWIVGFCLLMTVPYAGIMERLFWKQIYGRKTKKIQNDNRKVRVRKKKSYKEVRPKALVSTGTATPTQTMPDDLMIDSMSIDKSTAFKENAHFSHRELSDDMGFDTDDPFGQDNMDDTLMPMDFADEAKEPVVEDLPLIMQESGCRVWSDVTVGDIQIDWLAVTKDAIYFVQKDSDGGEWLADEERFNNEDPLWYSESSHRVSPVALLLQKQNDILRVLKTAGVNLEGRSILVKDNGTIINAEDMMSTWEELNVTVCRTGKGQPDELPVFGTAFPSTNEMPDDAVINEIQLALDLT